MKKLITLVMVLCLSMTLLAACGGGSGSNSAYRVIVKDESGAGVQGVMIQFCSDTLCKTEETDADGIAVFEDQPGVYTVHVYSVPEGYAEDETEYEVPEKYGDINITLKAAAE